MSEYQYYEFRAIDQPLDRKAMDELRAVSSRAEITATSFTNTYNFGDFRGDPDALMERYFDAFVYVANWGTHQLKLRLPRRFLDIKTAEAYCDGTVVSLTVDKEHVVIDFSARDEADDDDWIEGEFWMPSLISIRDELMRGDLRALYLGWLASFPDRGWNEGDDLEEDDLEPPVPPGLKQLSGPLQTFSDFLRIDDDLLEVASSSSTGTAAAAPSRADVEKWVRTLPLADKDAYLSRFLVEEDSDYLIRTELSRRFREATSSPGKSPTSGNPRRSVSELLAARDALAAKKSREAAEQAALVKARRERQEAEARKRFLDDLARREPAAWVEVDRLIATKLPKNYDLAATLLGDLRDLAARSGRTDAALARIRELRDQHAKKPSLIQRLDKKGLGA